MIREQDVETARETLESWNFLSAFNRNKAEFHELASIALRVLDTVGYERHAEDQPALKRLLSEALHASLLFQTLCKRKARFMAPEIRPVIAECLAVLMIQDVEGIPRRS